MRVAAVPPALCYTEKVATWLGNSENNRGRFGGTWGVD